MWPPQFWLPASLDFFLRKAQDVVLTSPLEGGVRQAIELKIGRNSSWGEADLFGGLARGFSLGCWIKPWFWPLWDPLLFRKKLSSDRQPGFPAWSLAPCPEQFRS